MIFSKKRIIYSILIIAVIFLDYRIFLSLDAPRNCYIPKRNTTLLGANNNLNSSSVICMRAPTFKEDILNALRSKQINQTWVYCSLINGSVFNSLALHTQVKCTNRLAPAINFTEQSGLNPNSIKKNVSFNLP